MIVKLRSTNWKQNGGAVERQKNRTNGLISGVKQIVILEF